MALHESTPSPGPEHPRLSMVIPCYNGEPTIGRTLEKLGAYLAEQEHQLGSSEILVVDDGSVDRTGEVVRETFPGVRLISLPRNRGKGAAVRTGMIEARGAFRFFVDADLPYDLTALPLMLQYLDLKEFDLCIGSRVHARSIAHVKRSRLRRAASALYTEFVGRIVTTGVRDTQCGFKGFRAAAARYLFGQSRVDNFAFDIEILYLAFKNDLDIKRVPVELLQDDYSTVSVFRHGGGMLLETLMLPVRYHSGQYRMMTAAEREQRG